MRLTKDVRWQLHPALGQVDKLGIRARWTLKQYLQVLQRPGVACERVELAMSTFDSSSSATGSLLLDTMSEANFAGNKNYTSAHLDEV